MHSATWGMGLLSRVSRERRLILKVSSAGKSTNAIDLPSGDQLIGAVPVSGMRIDRSFLSGPPSAGTTYRPVSAPEMRLKAICVPSGDQAGQMRSMGYALSATSSHYR